MISLLFGSFFALLVLGLPIAVAIGLTVIVVLYTFDIPLIVATQRMFAGTDSFPLVAIPFFILAGDLMAKGKVSEKMVQFADALLGFVKGGLWVVAVLASMFFAAISGSGAATTAASTIQGQPNKGDKHAPDRYADARRRGQIQRLSCQGTFVVPADSHHRRL